MATRATAFDPVLRGFGGQSPLWKYGVADCQPTLKLSAIACRLSRVGYRSYHDQPCVSFLPSFVVFPCTKHFRRFQQSVLVPNNTPISYLVTSFAFHPFSTMSAKADIGLCVALTQKELRRALAGRNSGIRPFIAVVIGSSCFKTRSI